MELSNDWEYYADSKRKLELIKHWRQLRKKRFEIEKYLTDRTGVTGKLRAEDSLADALRNGSDETILTRMKDLYDWEWYCNQKSHPVENEVYRKLLTHVYHRELHYNFLTNEFSDKIILPN